MNAGAAGTASDSYRTRGETVAQDETDVAARLAEALLASLRDSNPLYYEDAATELAAALLPVVRELGDLRVAEMRQILADLVEAVGRGDEVGLPEAYRAAVATLRGEAGR